MESNAAAQRYERLRKEAQQLKPETVGTAEQIAKNTLSTLKNWSKPRRRANKVA